MPGMDAMPEPGSNAARDSAPSGTALRVPLQMMRQVIGHLASALPLEGCGLLAIASSGDHEHKAVKFYPGTNVDQSSTRYTMDPVEVLAAFKEMRANDWELGAIVHSHPHSEANPSPTDLREAYYPDALMLIVSFAGAAPKVRAWNVAGVDGERHVVEREVVVE